MYVYLVKSDVSSIHPLVYSHNKHLRNVQCTVRCTWTLYDCTCTCSLISRLHNLFAVAREQWESEGGIKTCVYTNLSSGTHTVSVYSMYTEWHSPRDFISQDLYFSHANNKQAGKPVGWCSLLCVPCTISLMMLYMCIYWPMFHPENGFGRILGLENQQEGKLIYIVR